MIDEALLIEDVIKSTSNYISDRIASENFIKLIESQPKVNEWIPVSEKLPEVEKEVLVYTYGHLQRVWCLLDHDEEYVWEDSLGGWNEFEDVIAWMSLPPAYKEGLK